MKESNLYCCYSVPLMNFLTKNGLRYEIAALNKNTKNTMWVYMRTEKLNKLLEKWSQGGN